MQAAKLDPYCEAAFLHLGMYYTRRGDHQYVVGTRSVYLQYAPLLLRYICLTVGEV